MSDHQEAVEATTSEKPSEYEAPVVEDLEAVDGPAVTAAANSQPFT